MCNSLVARMFFFGTDGRSSAGGDAESAVEAQEFSMAILNASLDAIVVIDDHGTIQIVNDAACEMFRCVGRRGGPAAESNTPPECVMRPLSPRHCRTLTPPPAQYTREELVSQNVNMFMTPDIAKLHPGILARYRATGIKSMVGSRDRRAPAQRKDGTVFRIRAAVSEVMRGGQRAFVGVLHDVTHEEQASSAREEVAVQKRLQEAKSSFLAAMSHEIRTPLNGIGGMIDLLGDTELDEAQRSWLATCSRSIDARE